MSVQDKEEADYVEWLKSQAEVEGPEEAKDMVSEWVSQCMMGKYA